MELDENYNIFVWMELDETEGAQRTTSVCCIRVVLLEALFTPISRKSLILIKIENCPELELRVRNSEIMNEFLDLTNQKFVKLPRVFHESFFPKYNFKIISAGKIYLSICLELNEWDWSMKEKKSVKCFKVCRYTLTWNILKNIACTNFVNINIALNLYSYEGNYSFILNFMKKMYLLLLFKS